MRILLIALVFCCAALACGCVSTALPPVTDAGFTGLENDEAGLWKKAEEQEKLLAESGFVYDDKALEEYVNSVAKKLVPESVLKVIPFKIRILKDPHLNAFALPNGAVYIHTGLLAAMTNEAQLAGLLGHEMTHATKRHEIRRFRSTINKSAALGALVVATGGVGAVLAPVAVASAAGYSRDLEREADQEGFAVMERAGYSTDEVVTLFEQLKREIEEEKIEEPFFFSTHPRVVERIESYRELIAAQKGKQQPRIKNGEIFLVHVKKVVLENARLDIQNGRYKWAEGGLKRYIERYPGEAAAYFLLGEANRQQGGAEHEKLAAENYDKALTFDKAHAASHKMLGIMAYKAGDKTSAKEHLEKYLILDPAASDRSYIEGYIRACRAGVGTN